MAPKRGTTKMTDQAPNAEAPKKTRKKQGPRVAKPLHILVRATDEAGNAIELHKDRVTIEVVKDPAVLLELFTSGAGMEGAAYVKFTPSAAG